MSMVMSDANYDPQGLLAHIPVAHQRTLLFNNIEKETIQLAEYFPRFGFERKFWRSVAFFGVLNLMIMFGFATVTLGLNWSALPENGWLLILFILLIWVICFLISTSVFSEGKWTHLCGESLIVTNYRLIRVISPLRMHR